jgi:UDP-N-acetylmuramoyl-tripeptide--D-alanyl-D-alanine ligase
MPHITTQDIAETPTLRSVTQTDQPFTGVSIDSRTVQAGDLFIAIRGPRLDGHEYIRQAAERGAGGAVVSPEWAAVQDNHEILPRLYTAEDGLEVLQGLARTVRRRMRAQVIGITGTNGKTSTKDLTAAVLTGSFKVGQSPGNYNNQYGVPLAILGMPDNVDTLVLEMGASRPGDIAELCDIAEPVCGVLTNVGKAHLEFFKTFDRIIQTKGELLQALHANGTGIINGDQPELQHWYDVPARRRTFGVSDGVDVRATDIHLDAAGHPTFRINEMSPITMQMPGRTAIMNALAAAAVAIEFGIEDDVIRTRLEVWSGTPQRLEIIDCGGIRVINDSYNANPDSVAAALVLLQDLHQSANTCGYAALGDMLELGEASEPEHRRIGTLCADIQLDGVFTLGNETSALCDAATAGGTPALHCANHMEMVEALQTQLKPGDYLLVKGSRSMQMEQIIDALGASPDTEQSQ